MNIRSAVLFLGGVLAALATAVVAGGPLAHADESTGPSPGDPWFFTTWPEPDESVRTSYETINTGPLAWTTLLTYHYTNFADGSSDIVGAYDISEKLQQQDGILYSSGLETQIVTDGSGVGPPIGTEWDSYGFDLRLMPGPVTIFQLPVLDYQTIDIPGGMSGSFVTLFGVVGNEFVSEPGGMADYLYLGGDFIPLFDTLPG